MGWIIAASIIAILMSPLFIPTTLRARWDRDHRDWSVHIGPLKIAPDTQELLAKYKAVAIKITQPFVIIFKAVFWLIKKIIAVIVLLYMGISWPLRRIITFIKTRRSKPKKVDLQEKETEDRFEESNAIDSKEETTNYSISSDEENREEAFIDEYEEFETEIEESVDEEPIDSESEEDSEASGEWEWKNPFEDLIEQFNRFTNRFLKIGTKFSKSSEKVNKGIELYEAYGPLAKRILKRIFKFISGLLKVVKFKTFKAHLQAGGDPATLGALLGWHQAFCASLGSSLSKNLIFDPDYDSEEVAISGSLNIIVVIWPYKIIVPILRLLVTMPWIALIKVYRTQKKKSS